MNTFAFAGVSSQGTASPHWVYFQLPDGRWTYTLSGVVLMTFQGQGADFRRDQLQFDVPIPDLPPGQGLKLHMWAPLVTLNAISNNGVSNDAGWAVDDFYLPEHGPMTRVRVQAGLAVRDSDGFVLRVGYMINLLGTHERLPAGPK
jgi:hypothetical protein